jgi:hypothetical protein
VTPQPTPARQALLASLAYAAALLAIVCWVAVNEAAYKDLQAGYQVKLEMLDGLKMRQSDLLGRNSRSVIDIDAATIAASSETVAASALQGYLLNRLESAGGFVQSVQAEPKRETMPPGLRRLGAQLAFEASMAALQRFLFELEIALPLVFIDSLAVQPATAMQPDARVGDRLRVILTVTSYWKAGEGAGMDR